MSYYKELKDGILSLKDVFFLSPREIWFLKFLEDAQYPLQVVKEGINEFYRAVPPEKRSKTPLFFAFENIKKAYHRYTLQQGRSVKIDWLKTYEEKLKQVRRFLEDIKLKEPKTPEEAEENLKLIEGVITKKLWDSLKKEEKAKILKKYSQFKENEELFKLMIKHELMKMFNLPLLSIYVL
jgi:hypothetical protein